MKKDSIENETKEMPSFYRFVSLYQWYMNSKRDYGDGVLHSMVEMHILDIICKNPGITVGLVAQSWGHTKGAASQNISRLEKYGLVDRRRSLNNKRVVNLYPTDSGLKLAKLHEEYDIKAEGRLTEELLKLCSYDDLKHFDKMLGIYSDVLETELKNI